jgi:hypothetical protein
MDAHFTISKMIWFQFLTVDFPTPESGLACEPGVGERGG